MLPTALRTVPCLPPSSLSDAKSKWSVRALLAEAADDRATDDIDADLGGGLLPGWDDAGVQARVKQVLHRSPQSRASHNQSSYRNPAQSVHIHRNGSIRVDTLAPGDGPVHDASVQQPTRPMHKSNAVAQDIVQSVEKRLVEEKHRVMASYRQRQVRKMLLLSLLFSL